MEPKIYSLEIRENNKLTRIFQAVFGLLSIAVACYWLVYNFKAVKTDNTLWITVAFLVAFGAYMIYSGLGYAGKFIEFGNEGIRLRNNSILPAVLLAAINMERIEVYPLKVQFWLKGPKMIRLRFGVSDTQKIERVKDEIMKFAEQNNITLELKNEEV